ncbi:DUF1543 domain-containing protein [Sphingomonas sp. CGMCC 1.13654]|uniref:DUF1543 domain-containing protein n=1 Tax=Sphingomonas chungangi TaxID=2683589 RepID=A0A838LBG4_9SPHN|nr:DUF1543 domain-containing protein [Sphingomonas chungangi]MBA2935929.1 DUF1543 domain-containing protein [Sphingomonas chungangi]MVW54620.1 DUF1543 domain-containing protein [Sphingomonas chungangi]
MKLFAIYIGGEVARANIEVHDMRFVVAPSIRETHDELRRQWWGRPGSLHIDCWAEIDHADGYDVSLRAEPFEASERLYYVNLGGYDPSDFSEKHRNMFVVAESIAQAKSRALRTVRDWDAAHRDDLYEAEQAFALDKAASEQRLFIHLNRSDKARPLRFTCEYLPLKGKAKAETSV